MTADEESASNVAGSPCATRYPPATPKREALTGNDMSRGSSQPTYDSFFTAEESASSVSPETSRVIRRTRSAARNSSLIASASAKDVSSASPVPSTPFRGLADLRVKTSVTPHLDRVLSFHQKVTPSMFSPDVFSSFALDSDTPGSHDSIQSFFGNWRFYSPGLRDATGGEIPPNSSDDASLDNDSSDEGHQVFLRPQPYSLPSATRSAPFLPVRNVIPANGAETGKFYSVPLNRTKSLSALPTASTRSGRVRSATISMTDSERDHSHAFNMNSSSEAMRFARHSPDAHEADTTGSTLATYEIIGSLDKSARNGKCMAATPKLISKPLQRLQKVVNRLLA